MEQREFIAALKGLSTNHREFSAVARNIGNTSKDLKPLIGKPDGKDTSSKLISIGVAIIASPDPFVITDIAGSALVAAGLLKRKMKNPTISDIGKETLKLMKIFENETDKIHMGRFKR